MLFRSVHRTKLSGVGEPTARGDGGGSDERSGFGASSTLKGPTYFGNSLDACPFRSDKSAVETYTRSPTVNGCSLHRWQLA